jgi:tetratricopeptide (TPR) repeat protein
LAISERLANSDPGNAAWQRDLSISFNKLGDLAVAQGDLLTAASRFSHALAISERLANSDPGNADWQRDLWVSYWKMADLSKKRGEPSEAKGWWQKAYDTLAKMKRTGLHVSPQDERFFTQLRTMLEGA